MDEIGINNFDVFSVKGFGKENGIFCGVFDGHGRMGHVISRLVRDYLPFSILSQRNNSFHSRDESNFSDENSDCRVGLEAHDTRCSNLAMFEDWKQACINAMKAVDCELRFKPGLDSSFSGTTAVYIIKQVHKKLLLAPTKWELLLAPCKIWHHLF